MKIQNDPAAYGFLAGLIVMLLAALVLATGCAAGMRRGRSPEVALDSAVFIMTTCVDEAGETSGWYGSGVIVNDSTVLTAAHVAEDPEGSICVRRVVTADGKSHMMATGKSLPDRDLASLKTVFGKFGKTHPIVYGPPPKFGERVCSMTAYPMILWRCGEAQQPRDPPGDLSHTIVTEGGNSGAGVYDARGRLVGIITHRWSCSNGQLCGGKMATLEGYVRELLAT